MQQGFDPRKFLDLAKDLTIDGDYERDARARTAMGRLYYSVFLLAWQKLREKGIPIENDDKIHQSVIETYNDNRLSNIGNGLHQLRDKRRDADYYMMTSVTLADCKKCIELSDYIIDLIDQVREIR
jgi:uncharacterized protein (UPF0332 family)